YSDIEGGYAGEGNIDADPLFINIEEGDYHLRASSPCIGAGTAEGAPARDLDGDARPLEGAAAMGADEVNPGLAPAVAAIRRLSPVAELTNADEVKYSVVFSKPVTGLGRSHFSLDAVGVTNASVESVSGSGEAWQVTVKTGSGDGSLRLDVVSAAGITDASGNSVSNIPATGASYTIDKTPPSVSAGEDVSAKAKFTHVAVASDANPMTYQWTVVSGPGNLYFSPSNALSTIISAYGDGDYELLFTAMDAAGNSASDTMTLTWDGTPPAVKIGGGSTYSGGSLCLTITFTEVVTGFSINDITVANGAMTALTGSGGAYTLYIAPQAGAVTVNIGAAVAVDGLGNANTAAAPFTINDATPPAVALSTTAPEPFRAATMLVTITFSEPVTGFTVSDVTVTNGTLSDFTAVSSTVYTVEVTPAAEGAVTVQVASGVAIDSAGNSNTASTTLTRTYAKPVLTWLPLLLD
ncbi:MAG: Ig-like domain-containing protein, partial [Syntrophobacteraceae bacterium]